jgi:outer membrane protein assembly factor BamA
MFAKYSNYVPVRPTENYAFQALATNLRGYEQNSRNGNTYAVYNTELRLPILPTFMKRPIQSSFLRNLQAVAFVDAGSAWKGLAPNADALRNDRVLPDPSDPDPTYNVSLSIVDQTGGLGLGYGAGLRTSILGYFLRADAGWNIEGRRTPILYFSIGTDF